MAADGEPSRPVTVPGPRFVRAVEWVTELHDAQTRKGGDVPYVAHLLEVSALVLEDGGTESEAIAGLLHDAIEDARREAEEDPAAVRAQGGAHRRRLHRDPRRPAADEEARGPARRVHLAGAQGGVAHAPARPRHTHRRAAGQGRRRARQRPFDRRRPPPARSRDVAALPRRRGRPALVLPVARPRPRPAPPRPAHRRAPGDGAGDGAAGPAGGSTWATRSRAATDQRVPRLTRAIPRRIFPRTT